MTTDWCESERCHWMMMFMPRNQANWSVMPYTDLNSSALQKVIACHELFHSHTGSVPILPRRFASIGPSRFPDSSSIPALPDAL